MRPSSSSSSLEDLALVVVLPLDDDIERIPKEGGDEKEEEGSKRDYKNGDNDAGEGEEREGAASLEDAFDNNEIYGAIAYRCTTTTNAKVAKDEDIEEGRMVGIIQFWVCEIGHMEDVAELITEMDIDCIEHLTDIPCQEFEGGTGFELRFTFYFKTKKYFTDELLIKIYEVPNLLLDDETILKT